MPQHGEQQTLALSRSRVDHDAVLDRGGWRPIMIAELSIPIGRLDSPAPRFQRTVLAAHTPRKPSRSPNARIMFHGVSAVRLKASPHKAERYVCRGLEWWRYR